MFTGSATFGSSFISSSHWLMMRLEIGVIAEIVCICWGVSRATYPRKQSPFDYGSANAKTEQRRGVSHVAERHIRLKLLSHLVWFKAQKQGFAVIWEAFREFKVLTEGHLFLNQQLHVFIDLFSVRVQSFSEAVAVWLTIFTEALSPLSLSFSPPASRMTFLVWPRWRI